MIYPDFNRITIRERVGVSPVGSDTLLIARQVAQLEFNHALDVGTGTGFIPIYLGTLGRQCDGIDINLQAIHNASENAQLNRVQTHFYLSDLFANVYRKFDLIIFNPPYGNAHSTFFSRYLEIIKSMLPKENPLISKVVYLLIKKRRRLLISRFLDTVDDMLTDQGSIVILLHHTESDLIQYRMSHTLNKLGSQRLIFLSQLKS